MKQILLFIFLLGFEMLQADESEFSFEIFQQGEASLKYRLFKSESFQVGQKFAVVLTLHGSSLRGSDNKAQLKENRGPMELQRYIKKQQLNAIVVSPQCPSGQRWVETPWYGDSHTMPKEPNQTMSLTIALMKSLLKDPAVDPKRIYVTGLSLGGFGCWDIIQREPKLFAAAIPICGGGDPAYASDLKDMPIWIFHGDNDSIVKTKRSREMFTALKKVSELVKYTEYPNTGHDSFTETYNNDQVLNWLFSQSK